MHSLAVCADNIAAGELGQLQPGAYQSESLVGGIVLEFERYMLCHWYASVIHLYPMPGDGDALDTRSKEAVGIC